LIPVRGKHLDDLTTKDLVFIGISKVATAPFVYFYLRYAHFEPAVRWHLSDITMFNTLVPIVPLFVIYDFFYTLLHWFLHVKGVYGLVHKHHHAQMAPSRANVDAVNVHPVEFALGEYNHLLALALYCRFFRFGDVHVVAAMLFLAVGGILAGINHTRYDIAIGTNLIGGKGKGSLLGSSSGWIFNLYDSKAHDVHHRYPQSNYGQYVYFFERAKRF